LTGKQIIEKKTYDEKTEKEVTLSRKVKAVARTSKTIEQAHYEQ